MDEAREAAFRSWMTKCGPIPELVDSLSGPLSDAFDAGWEAGVAWAQWSQSGALWPAGVTCAESALVPHSWTHPNDEGISRCLHCDAVMDSGREEPFTPGQTAEQVLAQREQGQKNDHG